MLDHLVRAGRIVRVRDELPAQVEGGVVLDGGEVADLSSVDAVTGPSLNRAGRPAFFAAVERPGSSIGIC